MILFIVQEYNSFSGGGVISHRNLSVCKNIFGEENVTTFHLPARRGGIHTFIEFSTFYLLGLNKKLEQEILNKIASLPALKYVFLEYSLLGRLVPLIKRSFPHIRVIVFFHNVEIVYFKSFLKTSKRYLHSIGLPATAYNERKAIKNADTIIALNRRDSEMLYFQYGRGADLILPTSVTDTFDEQALVPVIPQQPLTLLFVGSRFFPNEQGVKWFIEEVMPHLKNAKLQIVGKGFEDLRNVWSRNNIEVIGAVDDLASYYYNADIVIAPIFTGSGMKTKTAEALMYGKTIAATSEAFEGYDIDKNAVGAELNDSERYIDFINTFQHSGPYKFNKISREIYKSKYTLASVSGHLLSYLSS